MDARVFLTLIVLGLAVSPARAESNTPSGPEAELQAREVLREWSEECLSFTGVRGEFLRIDYDDVFQQQKHSVGSFGYLGSQHAFIQVRPAPQKPDPDSLKKKNDGSPYEYKEGFSDEWRWQKPWIRNIDHMEKKYEEYKIVIRPPSDSEPKWFDFCLYFSEIENLMPVLPGVPDQAKFDEFISESYLKVIGENDTHIIIAGKPKNRRRAANLREFKLQLEKRPWRLRAVQYIPPSGNQSTVYLFSNVEFNPLAWDEPDLSDYQNLYTRSIFVRDPEKGEPQSFDKEAESQLSGISFLLALIYCCFNE
ncbi:MAG: hypothetical protein KDA70_01520 [Planctomycetaceae bacterium]|nr:hypothetical protein [Planctomycetaceae bacterium]